MPSTFLLSLALPLVLLACSGEGDPVSPDLDSGHADTVDEDAAPDVVEEDGATADVTPDPTPSEYCEATMEMFCTYYLRCGRMAANDMEGCRVRFAEACNGVYEPIYASLADAGLLALSPEGIAACADHLAEVECHQQMNDLDGPCGEIWLGLAPAGSACGVGIETFVCEPGSECLVSLDFCGVCEPVVGLGEACGDDARCPASARCVDGVCIARALPGDPCTERSQCVVGAECSDGTCRGKEIVAVGEPCDFTHRCPYASVCAGGTCAAQPLLGEPCDGPGWCASGWCDTDGICTALKAEGDSCSSSSECIGGCSDGTCVDPPSGCIR